MSCFRAKFKIAQKGRPWPDGSTPVSFCGMHVFDMKKKSDDFLSRYGPWALVTGGASGIGAEFGRQLATRGMNILVVDMQAAMAESRAAEIRTGFGVEARAVIVDLARPDFMAVLGKEIGDLEIGLLVNNAAFGTVGRFLDTDAEDMVRTLRVNCSATVMLVHELGRAMVRRGKGGIILIASTAAYTGTPLVSSYSATKAFNLVLGESLWAELADKGVDVLAFSPGPTNTPAFHAMRPDMKVATRMPFMEAEPTVAEALACLGKSPSAIAGRANRAAAFVMTRILPRGRAVRLVGKNTRNLYPGRD
jgi:short-subunit dehydrogenase